MHESARDGFARMLAKARELWPWEGAQVLDIGGMDVNGTIHDLIHGVHEDISLQDQPWRDWSVIDVLDIHPGPGVQIVADARTWRSSVVYDLVVTTECFEHVEDWEAVVDTAFAVLAPGGWFIGTAASLGRPEHGQHGAARPAPGEHYGNVVPSHLRKALVAAGFDRETVTVEHTPFPGDVYWRAWKAVDRG